MSDSSKVTKPSDSGAQTPAVPPVSPTTPPQKLPKRPRGKVNSRSPKVVRRMGVRKVRARRVRRTIRHVDPWSVFKIALPLCAAIYFALVVAFTVLLRAVERAGLIEKIEDFATSTLQFETFEIQMDTIERSIIVIGLVLAVVSAAALVLGAVLFNLISDIVGGIRISVIEEEPAVRVKQRSWAPRAKKPPTKKPSSKKRSATKQSATMPTSQVQPAETQTPKQAVPKPPTQSSQPQQHPAPTPPQRPSSEV
ncbi:MAG: DUF3566 domain-containing protein [Acidimicrobiales bacterium]